MALAFPATPSVADEWTDPAGRQWVCRNATPPIWDAKPKRQIIVSDAPPTNANPEDFWFDTGVSRALHAWHAANKQWYQTAAPSAYTPHGAVGLSITPDTAPSGSTFTANFVLTGDPLPQYTIEWLLNGNPIVGATTETVVATAAGQLKFQLTLSYGTLTRVAISPEVTVT